MYRLLLKTCIGYSTHVHVTRISNKKKNATAHMNYENVSDGINYDNVKDVQLKIIQGG